MNQSENVYDKNHREDIDVEQLLGALHEDTPIEKVEQEPKKEKEQIL